MAEETSSGPVVHVPTFDPTKPHGTIGHGRLEADQNPAELPRYHQNGAYFHPDKSFHSFDGLKPRLKVAETKQVDTLPALTEDEVAEVWMDHEAQCQELIELPRDALLKLVNAANGPMISGENSSRMMVAWIVHHAAQKEEL